MSHSSYIEGLIPLLKVLAKMQGIKTVTPGVIARVKGRCENLKIRLSVPINGGYKLVARKGSLVQEVFVTTCLKSQDLVDRIKNLTTESNKGKG